MDNKRIIFLDETALRLSEGPRSTLVLPDESSFIEVEDTSSYAARYDMIACINGERVFPPMIYSPSDRARAGVQGINKKMLEKYIQEILAQQFEALNLYPLILVMDRAPIHTTDLLNELHDRSCYAVKEIKLMPAQGAKRMSPLDNSLFHQWKEAIRKHGKITRTNIEQIMADEWNKITTKQIQSCYRQCKLMGRQNVYADCPDPSSHQHAT